MNVVDSEIVDELKKGTSEGIRLLVQKYQDRLYYWGRKEYAALSGHDVLQLVDDTFLRVIEAISSFELKSEKGFQNWVFTIFVNLTRDLLRKKKKLAEQVKMQSLDNDCAVTEEGEFARTRWELDRKIYLDYISAGLKENPLAPKVREFLKSLDEKNRTILQACAMRMPYREIAEWTGIPVNHVKVYYNRLKKRLEKYLLDGECESK